MPFRRVPAFAVSLLLLPTLLAGCQSASLSTHDPAPAPAAEAVPYQSMIARHAAEAGVPVDVATAFVELESGFRPRARGRAGEIGLMQIKLQTARGIGFSGSAEALYDPDTNLRYGMRYLGRAHELAGGDLCGTALRYQGGHRATRASAASRAYCAKLKGILAG